MLSNMPGSDVLGPSLSDPSHQKRPHPYSSSVGSSASSSSSSIFSLDCVSIQSSISSSSTTAVDVIWENESGESSGRGLPHSDNASHCLQNSLRGAASKVTECPVPPELRRHPRRTACPTATSNGTSTSCPRLPPPLVRQCDRKVNFVDSLVGKSSPEGSPSSNCFADLVMLSFLGKTPHPRLSKQYGPYR